MRPTRGRVRGRFGRGAAHFVAKCRTIPVFSKLQQRQKATSMADQATPAEIKHPLLEGANQLMIEKVPSYGNKFLYSLGFLTMIAFVVLLISGVFMTLFGPNWWLTTRVAAHASRQPPVRAEEGHEHSRDQEHHERDHGEESQ